MKTKAKEIENPVKKPNREGGRMTQILMYDNHFDCTVIFTKGRACECVDENFLVAMCNEKGLDPEKGDKRFIHIGYEKLVDDEPVLSWDKVYYGELVDLPKYEDSTLSVSWLDERFGLMQLSVDMWTCSENKDAGFYKVG
jgi:hypothetical protein